MEYLPAIISALGTIIAAWFAYNQYSKNKLTDLKIEKFKKDEAPLIFIINRNFRSFARNVESGASGSEYSFVSFNDDTDSFFGRLIGNIHDVCCLLGLYQIADII